MSTLTASTPLNMENAVCAVCGDKAVSAPVVASGLDFEYDTSGDTFTMVDCPLCHTLYLNPRPTAAELSRIYPANYYSYNYDSAISPLAVKAKDFLDKRKTRGWLKHVSTKELRFLDVGCGNGRNLQILAALGYARQNLYGMEINGDTVERIRKQGFHCVQGRVEEAAKDLEAASFDLIVLLQVLEHVGSPQTVIESLAKLLKPGGVLVVETPNSQSLDVELFRKRYWGGYHFPRHWYIFNPDNLEKLAAAADLTVKEVNYLPAQSFWIYSLHHIVKEKIAIPWVVRLFNPFQNLLLLSLFTSFDIVRAKLGAKTSNMQMILLRKQELEQDDKQR